MKGDAAGVRLVSASGASFSGGAVPEGVYDVVVVYTPGAPPIKVEQARVRAGATLTVNCSSSFMRCKVN